MSFIVCDLVHLSRVTFMCVSQGLFVTVDILLGNTPFGTGEHGSRRLFVFVVPPRFWVKDTKESVP